MTGPSRIERLRAQEGITPQLPAKPRKPLGRGLAAMMMDVPQPPAETTSMITLVPLQRLHVSPLNGRTTNPDEDIDWLADDIHENGLNQTLLVVPEAHGLFGPGDLGVVDGGRRYRAFMRNVELGRMAIEDPVPVLIRDVADGRVLSLLSEIHKVAMNPVDQLAIYAAIVEQHAGDEDPIAYCARRLGKPERHVRQRLRLANIAPEILARLHDGELSIDAAEAYAGIDDQKLQLQAYRDEEARVHGAKHLPRNIRDALRRRTYPASIRQAVYVGIDAYVAAGGRVDSDLFMGQEEGEQLLDPSLLDKLARDRAAAEVDQVARGDGYGEGRIALGFTHMPVWPTLKDHTITYAVDRLSPPERVPAIGLYALAEDGGMLELRAAALPIVLPPKVSPAPPRSPEPAARLDQAVAEIERHTPAGIAARLHNVKARTLAARLAVEHTIGAGLDGIRDRIRWAEHDDVMPTITEDGDPDTCLVAVWVRIPRAELEAALPVAEQQLEESSDA